MKGTKKLAAVFSGIAIAAASLSVGLLLDDSSKPTEAYAATPVQTTVPTAELSNLAWDEESVYVYNKGTAAPTIRFTVSSDTDYTLESATDLAFRFHVSYSQWNRPNNGNGLSWVRVKFKDSDTVYGITKADVYLPFVEEDGTVSQVRVSGGGENAVGGQINAAPGTDGTMYVPLSELRDGKLTTELGNAVTSVENYQSLAIEYVEYTFSGSRYDFAFGPIALVRQDNGTVTKDKLSATATTTATTVTLCKGIVYDKAAVMVNGVAATSDGNGKYVATLPDVGTFSYEYSEEKGVFAFNPLSVKLDAEGYGVTNAKIYVGDSYDETNEWSIDYCTSGYFKEGEIPLRWGFRSLMESRRGIAAPLVYESQNFKVDVTVSKLTKLTVDEEHVQLIYEKDLYNVVAKGGKPLTVDSTAGDGTLYVKTNETASVKVTYDDKFVFRGLAIGETELTGTANTDGSYTYSVKVTEDSAITVLGLGEEAEVSVTVGATGGSVTVDGAAVPEDGIVATNVYKTLSIAAIPEAGYEAEVKVIHTIESTEEGGEPTEQEEILTAGEDGKYAYVVDGDFEIAVTFSVANYTVTYRLNGGAYASGESNPETITYFDTVALKNVSKDGYDFKGWRLEGESEYVTELKNVDGDVTLIAVFELQEEPDPDTSDDSGSSSDSGTSSDSGSSDGTSVSDAGKSGGCGSSLTLGAGAALLTACGAFLLCRKKRD